MASDSESDHTSTTDETNAPDDGSVIETTLDDTTLQIIDSNNRKTRRTKKAKKRKRDKVSKSGRLGLSDNEQPHPSGRNAYCNKCGYFGKVTVHGRHLNPKLDDTLCKYLVFPRFLAY